MDAEAENLEPVREFKRRAERALPGRVAGVVLFGSRARGEAAADADWDVAVFLTGEPVRADRRALSDAAYDLVVETSHYIQHVPFAARRRNDETLLLDHIGRDGITI